MELITSPAKINLTLNVVGKLNNYHLLNSLTVFGIIEDKISIKPSPNWNIQSIGKFSSLVSEKNIVSKIIDLALTKNANIEPIEIIIEKNIPVGGGLGGGSSNAAAIARYLNQKYNIKFNNQELSLIGADIPCCYINKPLIFSGIGEKIDNYVSLPKLFIQIVNPLMPLLTADVFKKFNFKDSHQQNINLSSKYDDLHHLINDLKKYGNDLKTAALANLPQIQTILDLLQQQSGCIYTNISGSGPSCFAIFDSEENLHHSHLHFESQPIYYYSAIGSI